jgi:hypothetical protein
MQGPSTALLELSLCDRRDAYCYRILAGIENERSSNSSLGNPCTSRCKVATYGHHKAVSRIAVQHSSSPEGH